MPPPPHPPLAHPERAPAADALHGSPRRATVLWLGLLAATLLTWAVGEGGAAGPAVVTVLAVVSLAKGAAVILDFMALRHAPLLWRALTLGWMALIWALIALAYWSGLPQ